VTELHRQAVKLEMGKMGPGPDQISFFDRDRDQNIFDWDRHQNLFLKGPRPRPKTFFRRVRDQNFFFRRDRDRDEIFFLTGTKNDWSRSCLRKPDHVNQSWIFNKMRF
jgi:hypothetical protein